MALSNQKIIKIIDSILLTFNGEDEIPFAEVWTTEGVQAGPLVGEAVDALDKLLELRNQLEEEMYD